MILASLHTHPLAIIGNKVHSNSFYQAPLILNGNGHGNGHGHHRADRVEWMVSQLRKTRTAENRQLELLRQQAARTEAELVRQRVETSEKDLSVIAERKRGEAALQRLAAIVESSDDAIISKDLNGVITSWNQGAERIFGYSAHEVIGRSVTILMPPDRRNEEPGILNRIRHGDRVDHYETIRQHKDGSLIDISLTVSPIKDAEGRVIGASKIARDIRERKQADFALRAAQAELSRVNEELETRVQERTAELRELVSELESFSYSITHDMRAPLRSMQSFATLLEQDCGSQVSAEARDYLRRICVSAARMDQLIQDVLAYSRLARFQMPVQPVSLERLLRGILESYPGFQPPAANIEVSRPLLSVQANEAGLTQCLSNLIGNAVKFVPAGTVPALRIWTEAVDNGRVRIFVQDNGIGIAPEYHDRILGIFQRLSKAYEGTGIGLSIVKKAVERMGGAIGLRSEPGKGSTFWLELAPAMVEKKES